MGGWLGGIFEWLKDAANRDVLGWLGGGLIALLGFILARRNKQPPAPPPSTPVSNSQTVGGITSTAMVSIGLDEKQIAALMEENSRRLMERFDGLELAVKAKEAGLDREIIIKLAQPLAPDTALDFDRAVKELEHAVTVALDVIAKGERGTDEGAFVFVDKVLARVAELTKLGRFDEGSKAVDTALAEEEAASLQRRVTLLEAGIELDILRRDAPAVARRIEALVAAQSDERPTWSQTFLDYLRRYYEEGERKGVNFSLEITILLARRMSETAREADEGGKAAILLGNALVRLGERESGTERLQQAVAVFNEALKEYTCERVPLDWAMTQNNLGTALSMLGEREGGTKRLEQAVVAFQEALKERTRNRVPLDWAASQNNLGNALAKLGEWQSGTQRLEQAVVAFQEALKERTQNRVPLDWAITQNNLGNVLRVLGERESGTERLQQAVAAYEAALQEYTRDRVPLQWAGTQNNLGFALWRLGERESGTERLDQAVAAFGQAMTVFTPEAAPYYHEMAQRNLAKAQALLDARRKGN